MSSQADLLAQRATFEQAYSSGKISLSQYQAAMAYNTQQLAQYNLKQQQTTAPTPVNPLPNPLQNTLVDTSGNTWQNTNPVPTAPPEPTISKSQDVPPTLTNIFTNPIGVLGTITKYGGVAVDQLQAPQPVKTVANIASGAVGELSNLGAASKNVITGQNAPLPFTAMNPTQQLGQTAFKVSGAVSVAAVAPIVGPVVGVSAGGVLIGEGASIGISQGFKAIGGGGILTPEEAAMAAAEGGVFSLAGGAALKGIGIAGKTLGIGLPTGIKGTATAVMGRIAVNSGLGAGGSAILSGGNPNAIMQGAAFGAAFGLAGEAIGAGVKGIRGLIASKPVGVYNAKYTVGEAVDIPQKFPALEDLGFSKVKTKVDLKAVYETNKNVDAYLDKIGVSIKEPKVSEPSFVKSGEILGTVKIRTYDYGARNYGSSGAKLNIPTYDFTRLNTAEDYVKAGVMPMTQLEEEAATRMQMKTTFMEPDAFKDAKNLFNKRLLNGKLGNSDLAVSNRNLGLSRRSGSKAKLVNEKVNLDIGKIQGPKFNSWMNTYFYKSTGANSKRNKTVGSVFVAPKIANTLLPSVNPNPNVNFNPFPTPKTNPNLNPIPNLKPTPNFNPNPNPKPNPNFNPYPNPKPQPNPQPNPKPQTFPQPFPGTSKNPYIPKIRLPYFGMGGGNGFNRFGAGGGGQWFEKRHKIKTYNQMLKTVGVNMPKGTVKAFNKMDRSMQRLDKTASKMFKKQAKTKRRKK